MKRNCEIGNIQMKNRLQPSTNWKWWTNNLKLEIIS